MDIGDLLKNAPGLLDSVKQAGVPADKVDSLTSAMGQQLSGGDGFDIGDLLGGLDADAFMSKIDAGAIAAQVGISPEIVNSVLTLLAPKVAEFMPDGLGSIGASLGKLFD